MWNRKAWGYSSDPDVSALEGDVMMHTDSTGERLGKTSCWKHWGKHWGNDELKWLHIDVQSLVHWEYAGGMYFSNIFIMSLWHEIKIFFAKLPAFDLKSWEGQPLSHDCKGGGHLETQRFSIPSWTWWTLGATSFRAFADGLKPKITDVKTRLGIETGSSVSCSRLSIFGKSAKTTRIRSELVW